MGPGAVTVSREPANRWPGTAPRADVWVAVEHALGWGDADLTRSGHGVRVLMARGRRSGSGDHSGGHRWPSFTAPPSARAAIPRSRNRSTAPASACGSDTPPGPPPCGSGGSTVPRSWPAGTCRRSPPDRCATWGEPDPDPLLLVCANGRRDRCCGHEGGRLADALWRGPHADRVLTCTHLGGHRFAPTALLLPVGALHGRLDERQRRGPADAGPRLGAWPAHTPARPQHARPAGAGGRGPRARPHRVHGAGTPAGRADGLRRSRPAAAPPSAAGDLPTSLECPACALVRTSQLGPAVLRPRARPDHPLVHRPLTALRPPALAASAAAPPPDASAIARPVSSSSAVAAANRSEIRTDRGSTRGRGRRCRSGSPIRSPDGSRMPTMDLGLAGRTYLLTGASRGPRPGRPPRCSSPRAPAWSSAPGTTRTRQRPRAAGPGQRGGDLRRPRRSRLGRAARGRHGGAVRPSRRRPGQRRRPGHRDAR